VGEGNFEFETPPLRYPFCLIGEQGKGAAASCTTFALCYSTEKTSSTATRVHSGGGPGRPSSMTVSVGKFGWGGTIFKRQRD